MSRNFYTAQSTIIVEMQEKERKRNMDKDESKLCDYHEYFFMQRKKKKILLNCTTFFPFFLSNLSPLLFPQ